MEINLLKQNTPFKKRPKKSTKVFQKADIPVSQMLWASRMRRASPQTAYEERDTLTPYWTELATKLFFGYRPQKDNWIKDKI